MSLSKGEDVFERRILLIFGECACKRTELPPEGGGKYTVRLFAEDLRICRDLVLVLHRREDGWMLENGRMLRAGEPVYYEAGEKEPLLLLLSDRQLGLRPAGRLCLAVGETLRAGADFRNRIFYECGSLVDRQHVSLSRKKDGYVLTVQGEKGVYLNEEKTCGEKELKSGDRVDVYGLHLLVLKELLICTAFCGIYRLAEAKLELPAPQALRPVRRRCEKQQKQELAESLHSGEMELILPKPLPKEVEQPFLLTLGPSLTMVLPVLLMAQLGSRYMQGANGNFYYLSVAMSGCSALLAFFWGIMNLLYRRGHRKKEERQRIKSYRKYLRETEEYLLLCQKENRRILLKKYPSSGELLDVHKKSYTVLWNRYFGNRDFLFLPMGTGEIPFQITLKRARGEPSMEKEPLAEEAKTLLERFAGLSQVPVGIDLSKERQIGLVGGKFSPDLETVLVRLLFQAAVCLCYTELRIVCFYHRQSAAQQRIARIVKWLPHSWSADRKTRFVAGDEREAAELLPVLTGELERRQGESGAKDKLPWYLVLALNEELLRSEAVYGCLTDPGMHYPVTTVFLAGEQETLPKSCLFFIRRQEGQEEMVCRREERILRQRLQGDPADGTEVAAFARSLAGLRVKISEESGRLPEKIDFLQLFGCERLEELECGGRWQSGRPEERMKVPVGCGMNRNVVYLDIHEKFHGPHGLVAGTTGSGKSELLQTYLLSMAVSFSPVDVNFFMIDYKGGGTGNMLQKLPHCAGVISNLSGKQIRRAMSAITSENKRRQILLSQNGVNHIDAYMSLYREGRVSVAMPHLILVVDEFAELKKEEPEFMQEIITLAQVGRSLGVHLILATQKPAGTVDDKIWSNARFRLCLRVQDRQDSMDMLHNPDAAYLSTPGECYLQIGTHEHYELFRAGYCGGGYHREGKKKEEALLVTGTGRRVGLKEGEVKNVPGMLESVMSYVNQIADREGISKARQLWMPELPETIALESLKRPEEQKEAEILLGLCDDPQRQEQYIVRYLPGEEGHLAVFGGPATGKTTFLQTVIWQLGGYFQEQGVLLLLVDLDHEGLACLEQLPGCLGLLRDKADKEIFFYHLERLLGMRKKMLGGISFARHSRSSGERIPPLFLVIDNYGTLRRELNEEQEELLFRIAAEGISCGVFLIVAASAPGEIHGKVFEKIKTTIAFEMSDKFLYGDAMRQYHLTVLPQENCKGRGLVRAGGSILEFQSPVVREGLEDYQRLQWFAQEGARRTEELRRRQAALPERFPVLPKEPDTKLLLAVLEGEEKKLRIPLGYSLKSGEVVVHRPLPGSCFVITGNERTGKRTLLRCIAKGLQQQGFETALFDPGRRIGRQEELSLLNVSDPDRLLRFLERPVKGKTALLVSELAELTGQLCLPGGEKLQRLLEQVAGGKGKLTFLAGIYGERDYETEGTDFFKGIVSWQQGIHLGGNAAEQRLFDFDDLGYTILSRREPAGIGYYKAGPEAPTQRLLLAKNRKTEKGGSVNDSG